MQKFELMISVIKQNVYNTLALPVLQLLPSAVLQYNTHSAMDLNYISPFDNWFCVLQIIVVFREKKSIPR